jgi:hypothetical protein
MNSSLQEHKSILTAKDALETLCILPTYKYRERQLQSCPIFFFFSETCFSLPITKPKMYLTYEFAKIMLEILFFWQRI